MAYSILLHPEAENELQRLDASVRKAVIKKIVRIAEDPSIGKPLGNKWGMDLSNHFKVSVDDRRIRIVYRIESTPTVLCIIAIGKREGMNVYGTANRRKE